MAEETKQAAPRMVDRVNNVRALAKDAADAPMLNKAQAVTMVVNAAIDVMGEMAERLDRIGGGDA